MAIDLKLAIIAILRPLPVHQPAELVSLDSVGRGDANPFLSYPNYPWQAVAGLALASVMARFLGPLLNGAESAQLPAMVEATSALCCLALLHPLKALRYD